MNAFTIAVRTQDANTRILNTAKQLAPRYHANDQWVALEAVKDKDPQAETVKRLEAVAALLEQISNAPANTPAPVISAGIDNTPVPQFVPASDTGAAQRKGGKR